jgi:hypothetical protein
MQMKSFLTRRALTLMLSFLSLGPVSIQAADLSLPRRPATPEVWARTELYFGSDMPEGNVSEQDFKMFLDAQVTPRFPDGLTLLTGYGQFRNSDEVIVKERSAVLILFYPSQTAETNAKIQAIRDAYKTAFKQESVLRVDSLAVVSF